MSKSLSRKVLIVLVQLMFVLDFVNAQSSTNSADSTIPHEAQNSILSYQPSKALNSLFGALYIILSIFYIYYVRLHRDKWAICLPVGAVFSGIGFFTRLSLDPYNFELAKFATQQMFVVVSPSAFLAFVYLLYGRFIAAIDPNFSMENKSGSKKQKSKFSFIPPLIVGRIFIISDIITFLVQCAAGGMQAAAGATNPTLAEVGDKLYLIGVSAQGVSYILFTILLTVAFSRLIKDRKKNHPDQLRKGWTGLDKPTLTIVGGLYFSSIFIIIRSVFRIVEFSQGYDGYLIRHEVYLFVLDAAPLVLAIGIWAIIWPTVLLQRIAVLSRANQITPMSVGSTLDENYGKSDWVPLN
ncbi:hypothetical protein BGZ76_010166 [Entomortierella beljakovae]|nr:hypothetical protein BGZ76_010166 [Entomortierella beljakovae]